MVRILSVAAMVFVAALFGFIDETRAMSQFGRKALSRFSGNGPSEEELAVYGALESGMSVAEEEYFEEAQVDNFYTENRAGSYGPT